MLLAACPATSGLCQDLCYHPTVCLLGITAFAWQGTVLGRETTCNLQPSPTHMSQHLPPPHLFLESGVRDWRPGRPYGAEGCEPAAGTAASRACSAAAHCRAPGKPGQGQGCAECERCVRCSAGGARRPRLEGRTGGCHSATLSPGADGTSGIKPNGGDNSGAGKGSGQQCSGSRGGSRCHLCGSGGGSGGCTFRGRRAASCSRAPAARS